MRNETLKCSRNAFAKYSLLRDILLLYHPKSILLSIISRLLNPNREDRAYGI